MRKYIYCSLQCFASNRSATLVPQSSVFCYFHTYNRNTRGLAIFILNLFPGKLILGSSWRRHVNLSRKCLLEQVAAQRPILYVTLRESPECQIRGNSANRMSDLILFCLVGEGVEFSQKQLLTL